MVDNELLQAMRLMMQEEIGKALDEKLEPIKAEQKAMKADQESMQQTLTRIAITQENTIIPQLQLVYENQVKIIDEHKAMSKLERKVEVLQDEVFAIKEVLNELKRA